MIVEILLFIVMLGVLITFHELGHFLTAKLFKVYCFEFAVGMGPKLVQKKGKETKYTLRLLPIGGYVSMLGEQDTIPDGVTLSEEDKKRSLNTINRGKKALIMSAGIIVNLILGYTIFLIGNATTLQTQLVTQTTIQTGSVAENAGLNNDGALDFSLVTVSDGQFQSIGDATVSSQGAKEYYVSFQPVSYSDLTFGKENLTLIDKSISSLTQMDKVYKLQEGDVITLTIQYLVDPRAEEPVATPYTFTLNTIKEENKILIEDFGLSLSKHTYRYTFAEAIKASGEDFTFSATAVARGIASLFKKGGLSNVSGPVGIFTQVSQALSNYGIGRYLFYWGLISVNLAIFNLLPFPGLDGWHLLVTAIEAITRKEINPRVKNIVSAVGLILLLSLSFIILLKDIVGLF